MLYNHKSILNLSFQIIFSLDDLLLFFVPTNSLSYTHSNSHLNINDVQYIRDYINKCLANTTATHTCISTSASALNTFNTSILSPVYGESSTELNVIINIIYL